MHSFPKNIRLLSSPEFRRVLDQGAKSVRPEIVVFCMANTQLQKGRRLGLIVSRKVGNAVTRNLVKRRLRELFRQNIQAADDDSIDIVVVARERAATASSPQLLSSWQSGIARAKETLKVKNGVPVVTPTSEVPNVG